MMQAVTVAQLQKFGASLEQVRRFVDTFGESAEINAENFQRALAAKLNLVWLAKKLLPAPAWAELEKVRDAADAEYEKVLDAAWVEYWKVNDTTTVKYKRVKDAAVAEYEKVMNVALITAFGLDQLGR